MTERDKLLRKLNGHCATIPFNAWLGIEVVAVGDDHVELHVPWRDELEGSPGMIHGGILCSIVDVGAFMALVAATGTGGPTVDLRVDFHRSTFGGPLRVISRMMRAGATISSIDISVLDEESHLIASGRCCYLSKPRQAR